MVTAGAKPALTMALMAVLEEGDPVLLTCPYWASYTAIVEICGGRAVEVPAVPEQGFIHTGAQLAEAARAHGAKGVMLNFPNNPTGAVPSREQVADLVTACVENDLWILSDEIYARLIYDGVEHVSPAAFPEARERTIVVNGGTKSHSMTGWRVGFLAGPDDIIAAAARLQSQAIGNPCTISQAAALELCGETDDNELQRRLAAFDERRRFVCGRVESIDGLALQTPQGAFYAMLDVRSVCERLGVDDVQLTERLLNEALVAVVPGSAFRRPGFRAVELRGVARRPRQGVRPRRGLRCGRGLSMHQLDSLRGIDDLEDGEPLDTFALVRAVAAKTTRGGDPYVDLLLGDIHSSITAKVWADQDAAMSTARRLRAGHPVKVRGRKSSYRGAAQIEVRELRLVEPDSPDFRADALYGEGASLVATRMCRTLVFDIETVPGVSRRELPNTVAEGARDLRGSQGLRAGEGDGDVAVLRPRGESRVRGRGCRGRGSDGSRRAEVRRGTSRVHRTG